MGHALHLSTPLIICAVLLDAVLGDPPWLPHPARLIGEAITRGERALHTGDAARDLRAGVLLAAGIVGLSIIVTGIVITACDRISPTLGALAAIIIAWTTLAARGLDDAARQVQESLLRGDEAAARRAMPALVGRDPASLDGEAMIRATVESVAENSSDGVIAPLLFLFIAGPVGAIAYKAINTLDSMIGYRNERYVYFGRVAARLDDLANWIPARFTALCIAGASEIWLRRGRNAIATVRSDARRHESPNAGYPEAAMAGALGVQLGGSATYAGEKVDRATLGVAECPTTIDDIATARMVFKIAALIALFTLAIARAIFV